MKIENKLWDELNELADGFEYEPERKSNPDINLGSARINIFDAVDNIVISREEASRHTLSADGNSFYIERRYGTPTYTWNNTSELIYDSLRPSPGLNFRFDDLERTCTAGDLRTVDFNIDRITSGTINARISS